MANTRLGIAILSLICVHLGCAPVIEKKYDALASLIELGGIKQGEHVEKQLGPFKCRLLGVESSCECLTYRRAFVQGDEILVVRLENALQDGEENSTKEYVLAPFIRLSFDDGTKAEVEFRATMLGAVPTK